MSQQNVEAIRDAYERFRASGAFVRELATPDFVWDMSHFEGWPEEQVYEGAEGAEGFLGDWTSAWDDWTLDVVALHDAGEQVVAVLHQRGRSKATGLVVDMSFAQVWTMRDGKRARMDMYSDPQQALKAVRLEG
jgi:uncharacterized protein